MEPWFNMDSSGERGDAHASASESNYITGRGFGSSNGGGIGFLIVYKHTNWLNLISNGWKDLLNQNFSPTDKNYQWITLDIQAKT